MAPAVQRDRRHLRRHLAGVVALLNQLRESGVEADFVSDDGAKDPSFGKAPGDEAAGAVVTCPCGDPAQIEGAEDFVEGYKWLLERLYTAGNRLPSGSR